MKADDTAWWTMIATWAAVIAGFVAAMLNTAVLIFIYLRQQLQDRQTAQRRLDVARINIVSAISALRRAADKLRIGGAAGRIPKADVAGWIASAMAAIATIRATDISDPSFREATRQVQDVAAVMAKRIDGIDREWVLQHEVIGDLEPLLAQLTELQAAIAVMPVEA